MANKNERVARAQAQERAKAELKAKERRTTAIIIAASVLVTVVLAGVVYFIVDSSKTGTLAEVHSPGPADATGGIPVGTGGVAGVDVPADATRVDAYLDLMCPFCEKFETTNSQDLAALREDGTIAQYFHPVSILYDKSAGTNYSTRAANAVAVVADRAPEHFLDFLGALYANQPEENTPGLTDDQMAALAVGVGVPTDVAATFTNGEFTDWVLAATQQASVDGMGGTPTVMVNREVLDPHQVNFFSPGVFKSYLESLS